MCADRMKKHTKYHLKRKKTTMLVEKIRCLQKDSPNVSFSCKKVNTIATDYSSKLPVTGYWSPYNGYVTGYRIMDMLLVTV